MLYLLIRIESIVNFYKTFFIKYVSLKIKSFFAENTTLNRTNTM